MKQTTTTTMSINYTKAREQSVSKSESRTKVAIQMLKDIEGETSCIHYLGGTSTHTPFENNFEADQTFFRYERMRSLVPSGYKQVSFEHNGDYNIFNRKPIFEKRTNRHFINENIFDSLSIIMKTCKNMENHLWLDFCGAPKEIDLNVIFDYFLHEDGEEFKTLYLTFYLNPRNSKYAKRFFTGKETTLKERATNFLNKLKEDWQWENQTDKSIELFDHYNNGHSPMCVLKITQIERRNKETDMAKTASIENYVRLHSRGFSNKQIAIFWRAGIMQVAGYAACAKRKNLI